MNSGSMCILGVGGLEQPVDPEQPGARVAAAGEQQQAGARRMPEQLGHVEDGDLAVLALIVSPRPRQQHQRRGHLDGGDGDEGLRGAAHDGAAARRGDGGRRRLRRRLDAGDRPGEGAEVVEGAAIQLLWNNRKYVSCLKLVFSTIDTLGFIEYGLDGRNCFASWLDEYCDLGAVGVSSAELWELRNSLIHMTNLDSRKVRSGSTDRLLPRIADPDREVAPFVDGMKVFHVARFVAAVLPRGIEKWLQSYNQERGKFAEFVER